VTHPPRPQVNLRLEYVGPPEEYVQKLKAALKALGRAFHLRCVGLVELPTDPQKHLPPGQSANL
jgi:hypothetical protein